MLVLLSPAKKQSFDQALPECELTKPQTLADIQLLIAELKKLPASKLEKLMSISPTLAKLNHQRYKSFNPKQFTPANAMPAVFAFRGDAYQSLNIDDFNKNDLKFLQKHLLILSGLYGYLRPLDLIQAYRLEMKTPLKNPRGDNLYEFWDDRITTALNTAISQHKNQCIINLASTEYFKAIAPKKLNAELIQVEFKEKKNGQFKTIGIQAKRARGMMTRFIMLNRIDDMTGIQTFNEANYRFNRKLSSEKNLVFTRA